MQDKDEKVFQENVLKSSVKQHKNKLGIDWFTIISIIVAAKNANT